MRILGIDPSLRATGIAAGIYLFDKAEVVVDDLVLLTTERSAHRQIRRNSDDLRCAEELLSDLHDRIDYYKPTLIVAEIPSGAQSARASWTLGITLGLLATFSMRNLMLIQVDARDVKQHFTGSKTASKRAMIDAAVFKYPALPWLTHRGKTTNANEHLADAVAILEYGVTTAEARGYLELARLLTDSGAPA